MGILQLLNTSTHMMLPVEEDGVLVAVIAPMTFAVRRALDMAGVSLVREEMVDVWQLATDLGACGWSPDEGFLIHQ
jgi:hypothetical protein